jgi:peptide deformylase
MPCICITFAAFFSQHSMLLPIYALGQPVLKKIAAPITAEYPDLELLLSNMWETMYHADGVGLAAPQIGLSIRLFVADTTQVERKEPVAPHDEPFKRVFINAEMISRNTSFCPYEEGCLSIPDIRGDVDRPDQIRLRWVDENFVEHEEDFGGINARVIQHEYDHLEGILFTELLKPIRKRLIQRRLEAIRQGKIRTEYKMRFFTGR